MRRCVAAVLSFALFAFTSAAPAHAADGERGMFEWGVTLKAGFGVAIDANEKVALSTTKRGGFEVDLGERWSLDFDFQKQGMSQDAPGFAHLSGGTAVRIRQPLGESNWLVTGGLGGRLGLMVATTEIFGYSRPSPNDLRGFPLSPYAQAGFQWWPWKGLGFEFGFEYFPAFFRDGVIHQTAHVTSLCLSF
ncbi:MAG: hypothetical protein ACQEVA_12810 [Myxococcota bacterium]